MGTLVQFTISESSPEQAQAGIKAATTAMQAVENQFSLHSEAGNSVQRFNHAALNQPIHLSPEVAQLLRLSEQIQQQSGGAFSPWLAELDQLWGFSSDQERQQPPSKAQVLARLPSMPCSQQQAEHWQRLKPHCQLDFGGIAKGYAIDQGIKALQQAGIQHALINAGGDLRALGMHHGKAWRIGIRHPRKVHEIIGWVDLPAGMSMVTSGDYERFFMANGRRYHHILDPKTGWPARQASSSTIIAANASLADAWSTALFVAGPRLLPYLQKEKIAALWLNQQQDLHLNENMQALFHAGQPNG